MVTCEFLSDALRAELLSLTNNFRCVRNRNGKKIKLAGLVKQLREVYNLSRGFALLIAGAAVLLCGNTEDKTLCLGALARHGCLEHDYSLVHTDHAPRPSTSFFVAGRGGGGGGGAASMPSPGVAPPRSGHGLEEYAPTEVDYGKLQCLLDVTKEDYLTAQDFAQARLNLAACRSKYGTDKIEPLSWPHFSMIAGETCLIMDVFGHEVPIKGRDGVVRMVTVVDKSVLRTWMGEERLPENYVKPREQIRLSRLKEERAEHEELLKDNAHDDRESGKSLLQAIVGIGWDALVSLHRS